MSLQKKLAVALSHPDVPVPLFLTRQACTHTLPEHLYTCKHVHIPYVFMQYIKLQCLCNSRCAFRFVSFLFFWFYFLHLFLNCFSCSVRCYCLFRFDCIRSLFSFCFSVSPCLLSVVCALRAPLSVVSWSDDVRYPMPSAAP